MWGWIILGALSLGGLCFGAEEPVEPDKRESLPRLTVDIPEGDLDLVIGRWLRQSFFEGRMRYNFAKGDITAYLRYRYFGYKRVYQLGLFDEIEFSRIQEFESEFERIRGFHIFVEQPKDYYSRAFALVEIDQISSNKPEFQFSTDRTNTFIRLGYQIGSPDDSRSFSIIGNRRGRLERLFTSHDEIGPFGAGWTGAISWGMDGLGGDFDYLKAEISGVKRFNLSKNSFLIAGLHAGHFFHKVIERDDEEGFEGDRFSIPREEFFKLNGRENLKGVDEERLGTEELHVTLEYFIPWFENQERHFLKLDWTNWYWILYGGYGTVGFDTEVYGDLDYWIPDAGFGWEASFKVKRTPLFLGFLVAKSLDGEGDPKVRVTLRVAL